MNLRSAARRRQLGHLPGQVFWTFLASVGILWTVGAGGSGDAWARLGALVRRSREALRLNADEFAARAGIATKTVLRLEGGNEVRSRSLVGIDRGFGWPYGTTEAILAGAEPPTPGEQADQAPPHIDVEAAIEASMELSRTDKDALLTTLRALRAARAERPNGTRAAGT